MKTLFRILGTAAAVAVTGAAIVALDKILNQKDPLHVEEVEFPEEAEQDAAEAEKTAEAYAEAEAKAADDAAEQPTAPAAPPSPDRFSVVLTACPDGPETQSKVVELLMAELGISRAEAEAYVDNCTVVPSIVLREGMTQDAAQALTFVLRGVGAYARVVDPAQLEPSSPPPPPAEDPPADEGRGGMGFGGTVAAVIVGVIAALLILSLF